MMLDPPATLSCLEGLTKTVGFNHFGIEPVAPNSPAADWFTAGPVVSTKGGSIPLTVFALLSP